MKRYSHIIDFIRHNYSIENRSPDIIKYTNRFDNLKLIRFEKNNLVKFPFVEIKFHIQLNEEPKQILVNTYDCGYGNAFILALHNEGIGDYSIKDYCSYPIQDKRVKNNLDMSAILIRDSNSNKESFGIGIADSTKKISTILAIISAINRFN